MNYSWWSGVSESYLKNREDHIERKNDTPQYPLKYTIYNQFSKITQYIPLLADEVWLM